MYGLILTPLALCRQLMIRITSLSGCDSTVKVVVGDHAWGSTWHLHRALLTNRSLFFRAALSGNFLESSTNTVNLPDEDSEIFEIFVQWLYSTLQENKFDIKSIDCNVTIDTLVKTYCLATKFDSLPLVDSVLATLHEKPDLSKRLKPETLRYAWNNVHSGAALLELLLDTVSYAIAKREIRIVAEGDRLAKMKGATEWRQLIAGGGDLVVQLMARINAGCPGNGRRSLVTYLLRDKPKPR